MHDFAMKYRIGNLNRDRIRILCLALREIASDPSPVALPELKRRIIRAAKFTDDDRIIDLSGAMHILLDAGVIESNGYDPVERSLAIGRNTFFQAAPILADFIGRTFEEDEEAPE